MRNRRKKARRVLAEHLAHHSRKESAVTMTEIPAHIYHRIAEEVAKRHPQVTDETVRKVLDSLVEPVCVPADGRLVVRPSITAAIIAEARMYEDLKIVDMLVYQRIGADFFNKFGTSLAAYQIKALIETPGVIIGEPDDRINDEEVRDELERMAASYGITTGAS